MRNISKKVQKVMFYSLSLLHLIGVYTTVHAAGQDELWLKAVKIAEANQWIPGKIVENEKVFNTKGKLEEQTESHVQLLRQNSDKIEWKLLKCIKDGKDITPKARKEIDGILNTKETDELLDLKTPFESSFQDKMSVKRLEQNKKILGRDCVAFQWTYLVDEGETEEIEGVKGVAWIEEHTGVPFQIHSAVSDSFEEDEEDSVSKEKPIPTSQAIENLQEIVSSDKKKLIIEKLDSLDSSQLDKILNLINEMIKEDIQEVKFVKQKPKAVIQGQDFSLKVQAKLNGLSSNDVIVECVMSDVDTPDMFENYNTYKFSTDGPMLAKEQTFKLVISPDVSGMQYMKIRMYPYHKHLCHPFELGCMAWVQE